MKPLPKPAFIDPKYIVSFAIRFLGIALFSFTFCGISLFLMLNRRLGVGYFQDIATLSGLQERLPLILLTSGIIQAIALSLILFLFSLLWAHAVSGPLVRFRKYISMIGKDELVGEIVFREKDQLHYLAKAFQLMQADSRTRRDQFDAYLKKAEHLIGEYESLQHEKNVDPSKLKDRRAALKESYERMEALFRGEDAA